MNNNYLEIPKIGEHPIYKHPPVKTVITQFVYSRIPRINNDLKENFFNMLLKDYPRYSTYTNRPDDTQNIKRTGHTFANIDDLNSFNIQDDSFALTSNDYKGWDNFFGQLTSTYMLFKEYYQPQLVFRVGLRYINILEVDFFESYPDKPLSFFINKPFASIVENESFLNENIISFGSVLDVLQDNNTQAKLQYGIGRSEPNNERIFYIDIDVFTNQPVENNQVFEPLQKFHDIAYDAFRWVITDDMHSLLSED